VPVYMNFYMFHVKNPEALSNGSAKPIFEERGPYAYKETRYKVCWQKQCFYVVSHLRPVRKTVRLRKKRNYAVKLRKKNYAVKLMKNEIPHFNSAKIQTYEISTIYRLR
jgi:hypothetical protein